MKKNVIKKNLVLNVIKTIVVAIFPLITYPYISRVLGTENVGKINYVASIVSYFTIMAALGISSYAIRSGSPIRDDKEKRNLFFNEIYTINFLTTLGSYILLFLLCLIFSSLHSYWLLFIVQSLAFAFSLIGCEWVFSIYEDYLWITIRSFTAHALALIAIFIFVKSPDDYVLYSLITVLASGFSFVLNYFATSKYYRPRLTLNPKFKQHFLPMLLIGANVLAIMVYVSADTTMIGAMIGDYDVGLYSTGVKIYSMIKQVMSAIITVSTVRVALYFAQSKDNYDSLVNKMIKLLLLVSIPATAGLFMVSYDLVYLFAGEEYLLGTTALKILSFAIPFASLGSLASIYGLVVQKKEKDFLIITLIGAFVNVSLNFIFIPLFGINGAAITTLISEVLICVVFFIHTKFYAFLIKDIRILLFILFGVVFIVLVCFTFYYFIDNIFLRFFGSIIASILIYSVIILLSNDELIKSELGVFFQRKK